MESTSKKNHIRPSLSLPQTECSRNPIALFSFHASLKRQKQKTRIVSPDSVKDPTLSLVVGMCVGLSTFSRYLNNRYRVQDSTKTKTRDVLIHAWKSVPSTRGRIWFLQSRVIDHPSAVGRKKREGGEQPTGQWQITATEIGKKRSKRTQLTQLGLQQLQTWVNQLHFGTMRTRKESSAISLADISTEF